MSISCQQEITINVKGTIFYYWTLDEPLPASTHVDKSQGVVLTPAVGGGFALPGVGTGLFSNGVIFNNPVPQSAGLFSGGAVFPYIDPLLKYTHAQGLTAWGWFKMNAAYVAGAGPLVALFDFNFYDDNVATNQMGEIEMILGGANYRGVTRDDSIGEVVNGPAFAPVLGTWNFVVVRYNPATGLTSTRVNGAAFITGVTVLDMKTGPFGSMSINTSGGGTNLNMTVDEVGVVKEVLTNAQVDSLYNGGAGVTWPAVNTIVS